MDEAVAHLHILVDNAETYDVLLGSHFVNRVVNSTNPCKNYLEICLEWDVKGERTARVPIDTYIPPSRFLVPEDATNFQGFLGGPHDPESLRGQVAAQEVLEAQWHAQEAFRESRR